ncbi:MULTISPECIES: helix-turn-helix domain-containing protein [Actinomadura]|uniref:Helix-turn-helix domain-containing protein n=1 Tax=Actinomadura yumaensis TaxID=111807 RepID=A0ABW2CRT0_9ACTN|nr:helix-turn-helix transcriptional regulator [Actinomadura sp. J1-007]
MKSDKEVGDRIAALRTARRLSQSQLAESAPVSLSLLRKIEQGSRPATDRALEALAEALGVVPEVLAGRRAPSGSRVHAAIPDIRRAIDSYDLPEDGPVRTTPQLCRAADAATQLRLSSQYTKLAETIPPLLGELSRAVHVQGGMQTHQAATALMVAYRAADAVAYKYGYYDLSARLVELMRWAATKAEDPALAATAAYVRTEIFFASRNLATGLRALEMALDEVPSPSLTGQRAAVGALHMRAAVVAARLTEDPGAVEDHLSRARRLAATVPEGVYLGTAFGPASVHVHEVSVAVELGDAVRAVEVADQAVNLRARTREGRLTRNENSAQLLSV